MAVYHDQGKRPADFLQGITTELPPKYQELLRGGGGRRATINTGLTNQDDMQILLICEAMGIVGGQRAVAMDRGGYFISARVSRFTHGN